MSFEAQKFFILKKSKSFSCAFDVTCKVALPNPRTRRYNYIFFYRSFSSYIYIYASFWVKFVYGVKKGPNLISCPHTVLAPHQKRNYVNVKVYFWILNFIPLSYMSALKH